MEREREGGGGGEKQVGVFFVGKSDIQYRRHFIFSGPFRLPPLSIVFIFGFPLPLLGTSIPPLFTLPPLKPSPFSLFFPFPSPSPPPLPNHPYPPVNPSIPPSPSPKYIPSTDRYFHREKPRKRKKILDKGEFGEGRREREKSGEKKQKTKKKRAVRKTTAIKPNPPTIPTPLKEYSNLATSATESHTTKQCPQNRSRFYKFRIFGVWG